MIILVYVKYSTYNHSCAVLGFFVQFSLLVYFFSLIVIILMHYFSVTFKLNGFYSFKWLLSGSIGKIKTFIII